MLPLILIASAWSDNAKTDKSYIEQSADIEEQADLWSIDQTNHQKNIKLEKEGEKKEVLFPQKEHLQIIGRLSEGILKFKKKRGGWFRCGHRATEKEMEDWSVLWAYRIAEAAWNISDGEDDEWNLSPWGIAGLIMHESGMDECAVGPNVRGHAYKLELLKRSKITISHSKDDVINMLKDERMQKAFKETGVDIGPCQMLSRYYSRQTDYNAIMTLGYGLDECAREMRHRSNFYKSNTPWEVWPGSPKDWYKDRIERKCKMLGATKKDLRSGYRNR